MTSTIPVLPPIASKLDTTPMPPQRRRIRERLIYRVLDRTIGPIEILFAIGTLVGLTIGAMAGDSDFRILEALLGIPVMLLTVVFIVLHDPAFPSLMISVNVVALVTALYLMSRLRESSQNSTVNAAEQLS